MSMKTHTHKNTCVFITQKYLQYLPKTCNSFLNLMDFLMVDLGTLLYLNKSSLEDWPVSSKT